MASILDLYKTSQVQKINEAAIAMERTGFMIDLDFARWGQEKTKEDEVAALANLALSTAKCGVPPLGGIDLVWSSPPQLVKLLHEQLKLPPSPVRMKGQVDIDAGERATDKRALEYLVSHTENPDVKGLLEGIGDLRKVRSCAKYFNKLPGFVAPDGFIHPVTGPAGDGDDRVGAITGRFGMKNPEGQQIPRDKKKDRYRIRKMFIAPPGYRLISMDYKALEVVILANICKYLFDDDQLLEMTAPGFDIHSYNARRVFGTFLGWDDGTPEKRPLADIPEALWKDDATLSWFRDAIKEVWYGLMYGKSPMGFGMSLKDKLGNPIGLELAEKIVKALMDSVPVLYRWQDWCRKFIRRFGGVPALDGRWLDLRALLDLGRKGEGKANRAAYNYPMQASGAAVIGDAMIRVLACPILRALGCVLQLQIHDELMFRVPEEEVETALIVIQSHMEMSSAHTEFPLRNLIVTGGDGINWEECKG